MRGAASADAIRAAAAATRAAMVLMAVALAAAAPARAQDVLLTGTLQGIHDRGTILIGVRDGAVPFAFRNKAGQPVGFTVDLCRGIAADAAAALSQPLLEPEAPASDAGIRIVYVPVPADARIPKLLAGDIDLECGSTTDTADRERVVAFSPIFFLAGTRLLVAKDQGPAGFGDVKVLAVAAGTTNAEVVKRLAAQVNPPTRIVETAGVPEAYDQLAGGTVDAVASDDVLLAGLVATRPDGGRFRLAGDFLSFEPYGVAFRRDDPPFAGLVRSSFARMARDGILSARYRRWFTDRLPDGDNLDLPMSAQLTEMYRALGQPD